MAYLYTTTAPACGSAQPLHWRGNDNRRTPNALKRGEIIPNRKFREAKTQNLGKTTSLSILSTPVPPESSTLFAASTAVSSQRDREQEREREKEQEQEQGKGLFRLPLSVSSPGNAYIKHLVRLRQNPKIRTATASVLVVGTVPLREICESVDLVAAGRRGTNALIDVLLVRDDAANAVPEKLIRVSRRVVRVSSDAMSKLSGLDSAPELAGVLGFPPSFTSFQSLRPNSSSPKEESVRRWCGKAKPRRVLVLDAIQDPGNLGTLLRTAAAFAWDGVFLLHGCCDPFNDKALRAARGAGFRVPIAVGEWEHVREFAAANKLKLFAGDPQPERGSADRVSQGDQDEEFKDPLVEEGQGLCLVLGSEGQGLSDHVTKDCVPIGIPMPGNFESLNVAVAGGILMFLLR